MLVISYPPRTGRIISFKYWTNKHEETGAIEGIERLKTLTNGHYDLQKTRRDGHTQTIYRWNGTPYATDPILPLD